ncbi:hypothetical protein RTG_01521 [Rhodotorula toruloides ATCC 204091]|uniref:T-cell immunomodulatory protein TIP C2 domain-containing protein n=1 Tax=Rhodotorula toruloides TaxID=5286 RepID=A0A0K3CH51_RHOTO|nr:hypothetical protein RTG_01521 [Rhodotorula toruloides ATCC 204091]KAK4332994.1 hypothetical protein RTBOTA2_001705 [Rhodotorula toruloides]PRQ73640.1 hypothetical protein AAT19DRAFT_15207 [Rhodotorula toruloides]
MLYVASLAALVCVLTLPTPSRAWFPGVKKRYTDEKLIDAGPLGLPKTGLVAAWADWNADQLLDLFLVSSDQRTVSVHTWDRKAYEWKEAVEARIRTKSDFIITNVVPGDFDYDGKVDVLLMGGKNPGGWWGADETTEMQVYLQRGDGSWSEPYSIDSSALAQAMPIDATGDMRTDLLGLSTGSKPQLQLWNNTWAASNATNVFGVMDAPFDLSTAPTGKFDCKFPSPHFNAFIDLDGDCLADIFLTCQDGESEDDLSYQIWLNSKDGQFRYARRGKLPKATKSVGFADMDRDGTIDMVITSCPSADDCTLSIAYNDQMPLCESYMPADAKCRDLESLCVVDPDFSFDLSPSSSNPSFTQIPISSLLPSHTLVTSSTAFRGSFPTPPQIGDFNIDGYPDLLVLASSKGGRDKQAVILQSRPCEKGSCTEEEIKRGRRAFRVLSEGAEALTKIKDVESATWVDVDDDGSLDILVQRIGNSGAARQPVFIKNNYFHDAFFLKAQVLNGACQGWCEPKEPGEARYRPYGSSYSGASFKFTVLDPTGARRSTQYGQLPQSTYMSLSTPYSYFGLGRTNNYVENLFIGSTRHQSQHYINVEGLIPNSQVLVNPYQPANSKDPSSWTKMLYLHPGDWIPWVTIVLLAAIAILGATVIALHVREKREDEAERRARLLHLNFQAL